MMLLRLHFGSPKLPGRLVFTHTTYVFEDECGVRHVRSLSGPEDTAYPLRKWFGIVVWNRLFLGCMWLGLPRRD